MVQLKSCTTRFPGPLAAPVGAEANGFVATTFANSTWPDIQIAFVSSHGGFDGGTAFKDFLGISDEVHICSLKKSVCGEHWRLFLQLFQFYFAENAFREGFSIHPVLNRPRSRGRVELRSANPFDAPKIQPNYLSDRRDVDTLVEGLKIAYTLGNSPPFVNEYGAR